MTCGLAGCWQLPGLKAFWGEQETSESQRAVIGSQLRDPREGSHRNRTLTPALAQTSKAEEALEGKQTPRPLTQPSAMPETLTLSVLQAMPHGDQISGIGQI